MGEEIKRILVVCNIIKNCSSIHFGISMARKFGADLTILHVVHNPFGLKGWNVPMMSLEEDYKKLLEDEKNELDWMVENERVKGLTIRKLIREGEPIQEIRKVIEEEKIDLLIACHSEESRLEHYLFCRSNDELIRQMPCSIMLVKNELPGVPW
jgi:nucleotide-binding universal stress UspA family protein